MKFKLLALDIDGTIIQRHEQVGPELLGALAAAQAAGLKLCLATGRSFAEAKPVWQQLSFLQPAQPLVLVGGALVTEGTTGRTLYQRTIDRDLACQFAEALCQAGYCAVAAVDPWRHGVDFFRTSGGNDEIIQQRWLSRRTVNVQVSARLGDFKDMPNPLRVSTILTTPPNGLVSELRRQFGQSMNIHTIFVPAYDITILEAFSAGTDKFAALTYVAQAQRIGRGHIAAVGDDVNDLAMIQGAGLGVAMPQAHPELLKVANHVATEGLAQFVNDLVAGKFD